MTPDGSESPDWDRRFRPDRRHTLIALLGIGTAGVFPSTVVGAQFDSEELSTGRYLDTDDGTVLFTGTGEWSDTGEYSNEAGSPDPSFEGGATVGGGADNTARESWTTVAGGKNNTAKYSSATVGGGKNNEAGGFEATVSGGEGNEVDDIGGVIGGGGNNTAIGPYATVGGGVNNKTNTELATVGGGDGNTASGEATTVAGGTNCLASGDIATVGGGKENIASGDRAAIPGGAGNVASGTYSFAAGREADTNNHDGAVVFGDSSYRSVEAKSDDELRSQMPVYAPSFNSTSSRAVKTALEPVDPARLLDSVERLDLFTWEFDEHGGDGRHVGPMAEEFQSEFELGGDDGSISTVDADGVLFGAVQGLSSRLNKLQGDVEQLEAQVSDLQAENEQLRDRLNHLEKKVDSSD